MLYVVLLTFFKTRLCHLCLARLVTSVNKENSVGGTAESWANIYCIIHVLRICLPVSFNESLLSVP